VHANDLRSASRIRAGQRLKIPLRGQIILASNTRPSDPESTINYTVKRGDSLWLIAQRFNTTVAKIKALNQIQSNLLQAGQMILVQTNTR
jgi:LysM repeat protein